MAKIVVSMYNYVTGSQKAHSFPAFYEGFVNGLKNNGNDVLCYYHSTMLDDFPEVIPESVMSELKLFSPDLFIFFNNNFWDVTPYFDVPVVIYDVDSPNLYVSKKIIHEKENRFHFIVNQHIGVELVKHHFSVNDAMVRYIPPFTEVKAKELPLETNIMFCGSHWLWTGCDFIYEYMKKQPRREDREAAQKVLNAFLENPFVPYHKEYEELGLKSINKMSYDVRMASGRLSGVKRARYLTNIVDLGLEIRGNHWNHPSLNFFPEIALCYNHSEVTSIESTEQAYNSAKIGFNVNHIQAKSGFSWRVCDIMASNACLVTEYTEDINMLFGDIGIPIYESMNDAREKCIKVLNDEDLRLRIVEKCHEVIERNYRFANTLEQMEHFLGMKLRTNASNGTLIVKNIEEYLDIDKKKR